MKTAQFEKPFSYIKGCLPGNAFDSNRSGTPSNRTRQFMMSLKSDTIDGRNYD